jgi:hypothetical protein
MTDSVQQLLEKAQAASENAQQMAQQAQHAFGLVRFRIHSGSVGA